MLHEPALLPPPRATMGEGVAAVRTGRASTAMAAMRENIVGRVEMVLGGCVEYLVG